MVHILYKRVCYVATLYALLLYLLYSSEEDVDNTFFVLDETFPSGFEKRLKHSYKFRKVPKHKRISLLINWIYYHYVCFTKLPRIQHKTELFIQDHKLASKILAWSHNYTLIEDSAGVVSRFFTSYYGKQMIENRKNWKYKFFKTLYGPLYCYDFGCSEQCTRLLLTQEDKCSMLSNKERIFLPEIDEDLWNGFSEFKKNMILSIFDINKEDINKLSNRKYLLLTDPVWPDDAPYEEHDRIFRQIINRYPADELIIKTHPRDINYPYEKEFPGIPVFRRSIPMELFKILGVKFNTIITLFSTAVNQFGDVNIEWYGTEVSPFCMKLYGHIEPPKNAIIVKL